MKEKPDFLFSAGWRKNIDSFSKIRCKEENSAQGVSGNDTKKSWLYCATHSFEQFLLEFASFKRSSTKVKVIFRLIFFPQEIHLCYASKRWSFPWYVIVLHIRLSFYQDFMSRVTKI